MPPCSSPRLKDVNLLAEEFLNCAEPGRDADQPVEHRVVDMRVHHRPGRDTVLLQDDLLGIRAIARDDALQFAVIIRASAAIRRPGRKAKP